MVLQEMLKGPLVTGQLPEDITWPLLKILISPPLLAQTMRLLVLKQAKLRKQCDMLARYYVGNVPAR